MAFRKIGSCWHNGTEIRLSIDESLITPPVPVVQVSVRKWFQRSYGNTYHSVKVSVNWPSGRRKEAKRVDAYGYGDQWIVTALSLLAEMNLIKVQEIDSAEKSVKTLTAQDAGFAAYGCWRDLREALGVYMVLDVQDVLTRRKMINV